MSFKRFISKLFSNSDHVLARDADNWHNPNPDGLQFYRVLGGNTNNTRGICKQINGKYLHYLEILDLVKEDWDGKHPDTNETNILELVGGYCNEGDFDEKCHHSFMAVSEFGVPHRVLKRCYQKGYYKPPQRVIEEYGLDK